MTFGLWATLYLNNLYNLTLSSLKNRFFLLYFYVKCVWWCVSALLLLLKNRDLSPKIKKKSYEMFDRLCELSSKNQKGSFFWVFAEWSRWISWLIYEIKINYEIIKICEAYNIVIWESVGVLHLGHAKRGTNENASPCLIIKSCSKGFIYVHEHNNILFLFFLSLY